MYKYYLMEHPRTVSHGKPEIRAWVEINPETMEKTWFGKPEYVKMFKKSIEGLQKPPRDKYDYFPILGGVDFDPENMEHWERVMFMSETFLSEKVRLMVTNHGIQALNTYRRELKEKARAEFEKNYPAWLEKHGFEE